MIIKKPFFIYKIVVLLVLLITLGFMMQVAFSEALDIDGNDSTLHVESFPRSQESYHDSDLESYGAIIKNRIKLEPFNLIAVIIFFLAIAHTMLTSRFLKLAHHIEANYAELVKQGIKEKNSHSILASFLHLLGEIEVVFGFWAVFLAIAIGIYYDWGTFVHYVDGLSYAEPLFVIVIMTIASSRPILKLFEIIMWRIVRLFGDSLEVWWLTILVVSAILGAFITGPAAMAIAALLLADKFYSLNPSNRLKYITLALLFVNISVGGFLTNFASPPVMMVAGVWQWDMKFMIVTFGWKALIALGLSTLVYYLLVKKELKSMKKAYEDYKFKRYIQRRFISQKELEQSFTELEKLVDKRVQFSSELDAYSFILKENIKELAQLKLTKEECERYDINNAIDEKFDGIVEEELQKSIPGLLNQRDESLYIDPHWDKREDIVPVWIMVVHVFFLIWTVVNAEEMVLFLAGFLFYLGFYQVTEFYQNRLDLKPALLVAFFLAGIMIHGTLQGWWIAPLLASLPPLGLNVASTLLTAFNDNAAITYLSTLVTDFPDTLKYAVVSGALTGGGLTIIANSPNPIGQSVLKKYFDNGISAGQLFKYALLPTIITAVIFNVL